MQVIKKRRVKKSSVKTTEVVLVYYKCRMRARTTRSTLDGVYRMQRMVPLKYMHFCTSHQTNKRQPWF